MFAEADVVYVHGCRGRSTHNDVIEDGDTDNAGGLDESTGCLDVFSGGGWVTGGVVVDNDNGGSIATDCFFKDFAWMRGAGIQ